jgi:4-alpha-glucanotransferase
VIKLQFYIRFHTRYGQSLHITGNIEELGNNDTALALPLQYLNENYWHATVELNAKTAMSGINYHYFLKNDDGEIISEWGNDRLLSAGPKDTAEIVVTDTWNHAGEFENAFFTAPFSEVLLKSAHTKGKADADKPYTHIFRIKSPLLQKHEVMALAGSGVKLRDWSDTNPLLMERKGNWWEIKLDLSGEHFPVAYKYAVWNLKEERFLRFEDGDNRLLTPEPGVNRISIQHDGFAHLPNDTWKGAGVAIPVFSLRSKSSFGVGEFNDIKLLVDWSKHTGLKLIQLLPVNDTTATNTWLDSYPYAAISAFALHPLFINLSKVAGKEYASQLSNLKKKQKQLNELSVVDYEVVMKIKNSVLKELYEVMGEDCFATDEYKEFYKDNKHWLQPYAAFCFFRDKYGTSRFQEWKTNSSYNKGAIEKLFANGNATTKQLGLYCFIQYHLHVQLKEAVDYAHKKGIVIKGDIPIGIYRYGCDAWVEPELYNMDWQAGAPPDDFAAVGQNWGFPTYNWKRMQEDGFAWWKQRFEQMTNYFDAFRIDHILGFFRIWSIPVHAVQGIMGRFVPCVPVHINEFGENGIWFDYQRYCRPFIIDEVLYEIFREQAGYVKENFLVGNEFGSYDLSPDYSTQVQIENWYSTTDQSEFYDKIRLGLFDLTSNVLLFEEPGSMGQEYHFRIAMEKTSSFRFLIPHVQEKMKQLYINYFFRRQDDFWFREAMHKLPMLKAATNMLVCGEDLGMVPDCVPDVMKQTGILSLEIQRMPKDPEKEFFHPNDAPYMSVITPSTHDMSTLRGWWEENREKTQHFYNHVMGQWGEAPQYCEAWINRAIIMQHLYSPAMWSIFQLQDLMGMNETLRRQNPHEERINVPANPKNYWQYRMHISLEDLMKEDAFNEELKGYVENSGRGN